MPSAVKEELILYDRSPDGASELVPFENVFGKAVCIIEECIGVERVITHVIVGSAVEAVCAGFRDDAHDTAGVASVFSVVGARENLKFLNHVRIGIKNDAVIQKIGIDAAVEKIRDRILPSTGNAETGVGSPTHCSASASYRRNDTRL